MHNLQQLLTELDPGIIIAYQLETPVTASKLLQQIDAWRVALTSCPQTHIALFDHDSIRFTAALLACWHSGKTVIIPGDNLPGTLTQVSKLTTVGIGDFPNDESIQTIRYKQNNFTPPPLEILPETHPALIIFTSGSSGAPKAVNKHLNQLNSEIKHLEQLWGTQANNSHIVASISHQHIYGLLFKVLWPLCSSRPFISETCRYPEEILRALQRSKSMLVSSPAHIRRLPKSLPWKSLLQPPTLVFSSGGLLSQKDSLHAHRLLGCPISEIYGSSETGGIAQRQQIHANRNMPWQPLPEVEVTLAESGALKVRSPHLEDNQWYTTADSADLQEDGSFQLGLRLDRIAKIEGKRISLERIEKLLRAHSFVQDVRVLVLKGGREQLAAVVALTLDGKQQLSLGKHMLNQHLRKVLTTHIERIAIPRKWRYIEQLPHNSQGKITHAMLLTLFENKE